MSCYLCYHIFSNWQCRCIFVQLHTLTKSKHDGVGGLGGEREWVTLLFVLSHFELTCRAVAYLYSFTHFQLYVQFWREGGLCMA